MKISQVSMNGTDGAAALQVTFSTTRVDASVHHSYGGSECPNSTLSSAEIRDYSIRFLVEDWRWGEVGGEMEKRGSGHWKFQQEEPPPLSKRPAGGCV